MHTSTLPSSWPKGNIWDLQWCQAIISIRYCPLDSAALRVFTKMPRCRCKRKEKDHPRISISRWLADQLREVLWQAWTMSYLCFSSRASWQTTTNYLAIEFIGARIDSMMVRACLPYNWILLLQLLLNMVVLHLAVTVWTHLTLLSYMSVCAYGIPLARLHLPRLCL